MVFQANELNKENPSVNKVAKEVENLIKVEIRFEKLEENTKEFSVVAGQEIFSVSEDKNISPKYLKTGPQSCELQ